MLKALVHLALSNRVLTLIIAAALCIYGWIAASHLPIDVLPDLNRPAVSILTEAPGLAPEEVEAQITLAVENAVNGAAGVERVRSTSGIGLSVVHVEFAWGTNIYVNRQIVQERLAAVQQNLPVISGSRVTPHMGPISSIMGEIIIMGIASESLSPIQQRSIADWVIRPALLSIPGVAQVTVQGGDVRQFQVKADPDKLRLYDLTLEDLETAVEQANRATGGGFIIDNHREMVVRNLGRVHSLKDLENALVTIKTTDKHTVPVRVRDVARAVEGASINKRGEGSMMARPAVIFAISKQPTADTRDVTRAIDERLAQLAPSLPSDLVIKADLFRQSHFIESAVGNVIEALRDGSILVVIIIALFLLNFRATVITLTAIPLSILMTFIVFRMLGQSVNTMTLGGIAVAVGELVDDAVVGVENVVRRLRENRLLPKPMPTAQVVFDATCEVRSPILVGTAIVLLVFLPLFFLPGLPGKLFAPLAQAYILSILASMLVSLTITPVLAHFLLRSTVSHASSEKRDGPVLGACKRAALRAYALTMPRPIPVLIVCLAMVIIGAIAVTRIGSEFLPPFNEGTAVVSCNLQPGISLAESNRTAQQAEQLLLSIPEIKSTSRRTGRAEQDEHALGVHASEIDVDIWKIDEVKSGVAASRIDGRKITSLRSRPEVFADIREKLTAIPGAVVSVGQPIGHRIEHLESGVQAAIVVKIFGPDLARLRALAETAKAAMTGLPGVADLKVEQQVLIPQIRIKINSDRAAEYGFTNGVLVDMLETAVGGKVVSQVLDGLRSYDLVVMLDDPWRTTDPGWNPAQRVGSIRLVSPSGAVALISDVAEIQEYLSPNEVQRENAQRRIAVSCNVEDAAGNAKGGSDLGTTVAAIQQAIARDLKLPEGYTLTYEGSFQSQERATRVIVLLSMVSLLIMFAILWTTFRSAMMAVQVMLNIPFAFIGAVAALLIAGVPFSVASLIGFISLCGIAARNGVLMISHYIHLITVENQPFDKATIIRGSQERVAPVLMTALTTGLAMLPLLIHPDAPGKEVLYPVALVVFGGLVTSTLLDFFVTPTVFLRFCGPAARRLARNYANETSAAAESTVQSHA